MSRACRRTEVDHTLGQPPQPGAVDGGIPDLVGDKLGHRSGIRAGELARIVREQALGHELKQHVIVALEGGVHVHVGAKTREPILDEEPVSAAGLPSLLQNVERRPGAQRFERCRESLEILAILV